MCEGCYTESGSPEIVTARTLAAAKAIDDVYEHSPVGGRLHIVVDDWNLEDESIAFCADEIAKGERGEADWHGMSAEQLSAERNCATLLAALSLDERASALALHSGYLPDHRHPDTGHASTDEAKTGSSPTG